MPQRASQTIRNSFTRGLITEVSELNFPEDASVDELNCDLKLAGNRTKRLGVKYEDFNVLTDETYLEGTLYGTHTWENVGDNSDFEYLVVQAGSKLRFYLKGVEPLSEQIVPTSLSDSNPFIFDMSPYAISGGLGAGGSHVDVASINGVLVVVSPQINAFYLERNNNTGVFSATQIEFKIRDFTWFGDPDTRTEEEAESVPRLYDTMNAGWVGEKGDAALVTYRAANSDNLPPLTHPWYSGKNSDGNFTINKWDQVYSGNSQTTNGHFVIDLFEQDRDTASGLSGVEFYNGDPAPSLDNRFTTVATYAGRVFFSGADSRVYFSKLIDNIKEVGNLYQLNDPTAEDFSDLLDTDGGWARIADAVGIKKLHVFGAFLIVFADNGVWRISGVDDVFRATEFSVFKVSDFGLAYKKSFVAASNNQPFWWSYIGIHTLEVSESGGLQEVNISRPTIKAYIEDILPSQKAKIISAYDSINNTAYWLYPFANEPIEGKLNNILLLSIDLGAFYPWSISDKSSDTTPYVVGTSFFEGAGSGSVVFNVVDSSGDQVVDADGNEVIVTRQAGVVSSSEIKLLVRDPSGSLTFATFSDSTYYDWTDANYDAYAEAAYNFIGSIALRKTSPYITVLLRKLDPIGSCKLSAFWDFKTSPATTPQQAYKTIANGSMVANRLRLRGRGRVVKLRFEGEEGKGFDIVGWETLDVSNAGY